MQWTPLHDQLHKVIRSRNLLKRQQRILVAVSGGQDSLCLLKLMTDLQPKWQWQLGVAYCDHRWRPDSQENGAYVGKIAQDWQIPFFLEVAQIDLTNEAIARDWRYEILTQIATNQGYEYVVTGHTQSDRAETLLYNLLRGSGADGLQALTWQRPLSDKINLVRPMLTISRSQTGSFCTEQNLQVWEDTTNTDTKYARNRIRHELLPYLQQKFNPNIETTLARTAEILQADVECWENQAETDLQEALAPTANCSETCNNFHTKQINPSIYTEKINRNQLRSLPKSRQRRAMRKLLQNKLKISPNFDQVEKITNLINAPSRSQTDPFPGGAIARVEGEWIILDFRF